MSHHSLRAGALLVLALLSACGGGGDSSVSTTLAKQSFRVAELPEASTNAAGSSQQANPQIDQAVQAALKKYHLPGASVIVMKDQQVIYAKGYGYADLSARTPIKPEDRFQIGSISKTFVSAAIMLLVEDGKLSLDDPVGKYYSGLPATWSGITVRHLLSHTSGLPHEPTPEIEAQFDRFLAASDPERVAIIAATPLLFKPGAQYGYSNLGYTIAGILATRLAGMDYAELLQQRVFRPLGMKVYRIDASDALTTRGYKLEGDTLREITNSPGLNRFIAMGAGGLAMSALDLAKWDASLYGTQILKTASLAEMKTPQVKLGETSWYGLGWFLYTVNSHFLMKHAGNMSGYVSDYRRFPGERFSTIVLTNTGDASQDIYGALYIGRAITDQLQPALSVP